jgi:hypothetical protein
MRFVLAAVIASFALAAACSGGTTVHVDAKADGMGSGPPCTGAVYDPCTDPSQCMSGNCHFYMGNGFTVCTAACTPGMNSTCPVDATGSNGFCNNMGICKPAMPNNCSR